MRKCLAQLSNSPLFVLDLGKWATHLTYSQFTLIYPIYEY